MTIEKLNNRNNYRLREFIEGLKPSYNLDQAVDELQDLVIAILNEEIDDHRLIPRYLLEEAEARCDYDIR